MASSSKDWAQAVRVAERLQRGHRQVTADDEPSLLVQRVAQNVVLCGTATEHFSQDMPVWCPATSDEADLLPIDVLYGRYTAATKSIEIFINRIAQDAHTFGAEPDELRDVVRIHEHAHAVVHIGSRVDDAHRDLSTLGPGGKTDWHKFVGVRDSWFAALPVEIHESLAQSLTYAALRTLSAKARSDRLLKVFDALESKQPNHYKLSSNVKDRAATADWPLVLDAARGIADSYRSRAFTLTAGLEELISSPAL
jgi:hypothetical protein